jgi:hypothetical protein
MPRLEPLPIGAIPEVAEIYKRIEATGRYVRSSRIRLQLKPAVLRALRGLSTAAMNPGSDTFASPLDDEPIEFAGKRVRAHGKHGR